ncbi:carboxypeptidase-like regulatory domain-containing protein [Maribacter chungangensis]|uniref:Carboxypeptidase-like regulatory domain-containing protein n=1 Tax=Maribacter chungangensis TaxID=1069117 RepID=A0ABW3B2B1_9FLAO
MRKTHLNKLSFFLLCISLLLPLGKGLGQEQPKKTMGIIQLIKELEESHRIKFSYLDTVLSGIELEKPNEVDLDAILAQIQQRTPLIIKKVSDRYYSISQKNRITICARVLDNFQKNTIPGATIQVLGSSKSIITDLEGNFSLSDIPRTATIQINHIGFKTRFVPAEKLIQQPCSVVAMVQSYQELEEVVVYKFLTEGLTKLTDGSIELNTGGFGILPGLSEPDILQTIQALPGIKSVDETVSDINIRGGTNDQNLILWDGIKMYQSGHFFGLISAFNPYLTDKVTVIKNGSSARYGDGVSGVLDMRTKNTITNNFFGGAGFNLISGDAYGQVALTDNLALQFSGRRSHTDFIDTPTYTTFSQKAFQDTDVQADSDFYFYDFTGKVLYDFNPYHRLRISLIHIKNNLDYEESDLDGSPTNLSYLDQTNLSFGGILESDWTTNFSTRLSVYHTKYQLNALSISNEARQRLVQNNLVIEKSAKLNTTLQLSEDLKWDNGYHLTETGIANRTELNEPEFLSNSKGVIYNQALYSELSYRSPNQKLAAKAGGRLNYIQNPDTFDEAILEPRLNVSYTLAPFFKTEILGEFKSQTTNQIIDLEQNFLGIEKRRWVLADGNRLPITRSKQGSWGVNYDQNSFYAGIEAFYKEVDGINVRTQGFQNQNQFNGEVGSYAIKGIELLLNKKTDTYSIWLSYTYNQNDYSFNTLVPSSFPNNLDVRHTATLAGNYTYKQLKLGLGFNYRSGRPFTLPDAINPVDNTVVPNQIVYQAPNTERLAEYFRADFSAIYDFSITDNIKASAGVSVLNFTNRRNNLNTFFRLNDADTLERVERLSLGVTPNASFRIRF